MTLNTQKCRTKWLTVMTMLCSLLSMSKVTYADTAMGTSTITFDYPWPTCNIQVPAAADLGEVTPGSAVSGQPFTVNVTCPETTSYTLYMMSGNTLASGNQGLNMQRTDDNQNSNVILSLKGPSGSALTFSTGDSNPTPVVTGTTTQDVSITPSLTAPQGAKPGKIQGTVTFKLVYPA